MENSFSEVLTYPLLQKLIDNTSIVFIRLFFHDNILLNTFIYCVTLNSKIIIVERIRVSYLSSGTS